MSKIKINNINTEITRVEPGQYVFHHEMARTTKILYCTDNDTWQITTPGEHILGDLSHQKMVDILMGHCGFESAAALVLAAALTLELASKKEFENQLKETIEAKEAGLREMAGILKKTREYAEEMEEYNRQLVAQVNEYDEAEEADEKERELASEKRVSAKPDDEEEAADERVKEDV